MAVLPYNYDDGKIVLLPAKASVVFVKGGMVKDDAAGYIDVCVAGDGVTVRFVAAQTITAAATDGATLVPCWPTTGVRFIADTDADPAQTDVGTLCDIATGSTLDPDASADDIFFIEKILGPVADRKVLGFFSQANET